MLRGEWERIGEEVREGKEWQMKGSQGRGGGEVGGGEAEVKERVGRGDKRRGGDDKIGRWVGRKGN